MMNCKKCNSVLDSEESSDITKLKMPQVCTECFDDWLDDTELDALVSGGEAV